MASEAFEEIVADFSFLENWEDRYRYVIDLGRNMQELDPALRTQATKVSGCASQVWLHSSTSKGKFHFRGASDATIVRGLIAVLGALYDNEPLELVAKIDAISELKRLDLEDHLSSQRSNGLAAMIARIQQDAAKFEANG